MNDLKFYLLDKIDSASPIDPIREFDLLKSGFSTPVATQKALNDMKKQKFIRSPINSELLYLEPDGRTALESEKEKRYNDACNKRQQSFDNKVSVAMALVPAVTFFLGLIVEHSTQLIDFIVSLFK